MSNQRYFIVVDNLPQARGAVDELSFTGESPDELASDVQRALREPGLFERWRALQPEPDEVDPALGARDANATATARQADLRCELVITTSLPHSIVKHRLTLLVGRHWTLRDVAGA